MRISLKKEKIYRLKDIIDNSDCLFLIKSFDGRVQYINPALSKILDLPQVDAVNQCIKNLILNFVHPDDLLLSDQFFNEATPEGHIKEYQNRCRLQTGAYQAFSWILVPLPNKKSSLCNCR